MSYDTILLFEPREIDRLFPFSPMHCSWELRVGYFRLFEKFRAFAPEKTLVFSAEKTRLNSFLERKSSVDNILPAGGVLIFDSTYIPTKRVYDRINELVKDREKALLFTSAGAPFALFSPAGERLNPGQADLDFLPKLLVEFYDKYESEEIEDIRRIDFLFDAIEYNGDEIRNDFETLSSLFNRARIDFTGVHFVNRTDVFIGKGTEIAPGCVIDASEGPVIIGEKVKIMPNAVICGPAAICDGAIIKIGAKIYEKTTVGPISKVGGEVENSIIHACSNKQHDGFLGHSYISEWVNLGADTNTSDLKNNYGQVGVEIRGHRVSSGRTFLGLLCGDHTKTGINTMFNTGTVAGVSCNIFGAGYPDKYIDSFTWSPSEVYDLQKAIQTAETVMARRGKVMTKSERELFEREFRKTRG